MEDDDLLVPVVHVSSNDEAEPATGDPLEDPGTPSQEKNEALNPAVKVQCTDAKMAVQSMVFEKLKKTRKVWFCFCRQTLSFRVLHFSYLPFFFFFNIPVMLFRRQARSSGFKV